MTMFILFTSSACLQAKVIYYYEEQNQVGLKWHKVEAIESSVCLSGIAA